ncbi:MAG: VTT domain-containing protein, partial [Planococcus sp. (in: firmicutes)]|nr:VTT domain-containing protein [Planococcus sp. (in: firmicutes)]
IPDAWQQRSWFRFLRNQSPVSVWWAVLSLRILPFVPSGAVTAGAALTRISAPAFFAASSLGKLPAVAIEIAVAFGLVLWLPRSLLYGALGMCLVILLLIALIRKRNPKKNASQ